MNTKNKIKYLLNHNVVDAREQHLLELIARVDESLKMIREFVDRNIDNLLVDRFGAEHTFDIITEPDRHPAKFSMAEKEEAEDIGEIALLDEVDGEF